MQVVESIAVPLIAFTSLLAMGFAPVSMQSQVRSQYYAVLAFLWMITLWTVVDCGDCWLLHAGTLGTYIVGGLWLPTTTEHRFDRPGSGSQRQT